MLISLPPLIIPFLLTAIALRYNPRQSENYWFRVKCLNYAPIFKHKQPNESHTFDKRIYSVFKLRATVFNAITAILFVIIHFREC